jgi:hypothetical protein
MMDPDAGRLARERIAPRMDERRRLFRQRIEIIKNNMSLRGLGRSGALIETIQEACVQEAAARAELAWTELRNVLAALGVSFTEELAGDLKDEVRQQIHTGDLVESVNGAGGDDQSFRMTVERWLRMIGADIDLYAVNLKRLAEQQGRPGQPILNFLGPVGAVQTGAGAIANVVQDMGAGDREALSRALEAIRQALEVGKELVGARKAEVLELLEEGKRELAKERPNSVRLPGLLRDLATAVQTIPAAKEAYETLRALMTALGLG